MLQGVLLRISLGLHRYATILQGVSFRISVTCLGSCPFCNGHPLGLWMLLPFERSAPLLMAHAAQTKRYPQNPTTTQAAPH
jgi:hypothetical protein